MAKTLEISKLKTQYEFACNEYARKFANKQHIDFEFWVADEVGGIACFNSDYFFNISDIVLDINTKQPVGLILDWQNDGVETHFTHPEINSINYHSYTMGLRYEHIIEKSKNTI